MIYFLRHGLDDENYIGGWSDVDLIEEGRKQIEDIADYIIANNLKIKKIYCSDIKRAVSSAEIISQRLNIPIIFMKELRELNKGDINGLLKETAEKKFPEYFQGISIDTRYPNGESMTDFYERIKVNLDTILCDNDSLMITHRGVINMLYFILNNKDIDMDKTQFQAVHGSIHQYDSVMRKIKLLE